MTNPSTLLARHIIEVLRRAGITDVVLAPGSRNAPLAFAAFDAAEAGLLRLHTRIDERSAGFLALGLSKVGARSAVLCTSGTAVANLHPAVLEAAHAGVPLVLVTADRPVSLRGSGASQTTDQVGIFDTMAYCFDLAAETSPGVDELAEQVRWSEKPVHLNVQFELPLVPEDRWTPEPVPVVIDPPSEVPEPVELTLGPRTVVVAGDDAGQPPRVLAEAAGWPLFAEPTSGCRTGAKALRTYRLLLDSELGQQIERVVVAGHPTLSRPITRLLGREDVEVIELRHAGVWSRRPFEVSTSAEALRVAEAEDGAWLDAWQEAERQVSRGLDDLLVAEEELTPHEVAGAVSRAVPPGGLLFVGASSPIRDLDLMAKPFPVGQRRKIISNRGLAGIDGTISSAVGAALGRDSTRSLALMGDVTFLHDSGGLIVGPEETRPDLTIVVVNDDGGSIFAMLEQGGAAYSYAFEKTFGTPHGVDLAGLCAATRTPHWLVSSLPELEHALAQPAGGIEVIEVKCRRDNRRDLDERIRQLGSRWSKRPQGVVDSVG